MGEIRIIGPGKTHGYPYPVCMKIGVEIEKSKCVYTIFFDIKGHFHISVFEITRPNGTQYYCSCSSERYKVTLLYTLRWVICGKYKHLNKIAKIQHIHLKFNRLIIFYYSLQFTTKNRGRCCLK